MKKRISSSIAVLVGAASVCYVLNGTNPLLLGLASEEVPFNYSLDADDAATGLTDAYQEQVVDSRKDGSILTYRHAKAFDGGLVTLASGGSITKDVSFGLETFVATFDGELQLHIGLEEDKYTDHYRLVSGQTISNIEANYFRLIATAETNISSVEATYGCTSNNEDIKTHDHVFISTKLGTLARDYICETCGMKRYSTLTSSETNVDLLGTGTYNIRHGENAFSFKDSANSTFQYAFYSDEEQTGDIEIGLCIPGHIYGKTINEIFKLSLNGVELPNTTNTNAITDAATSWTQYVPVVFENQPIKKGVNYVKLTSVDGGCNTNVGYVNVSNTISAIHETLDYVQEGEFMTLSGSDQRTFDKTWRPSGAGYIKDMQYKNNRATFYVDSPVAQTVDFSVCLGLRNDNASAFNYIFSDYHMLTVNGVEQDGFKNSETIVPEKTLKSTWYDWEELLIGAIDLVAGKNTIVFGYTGDDVNHSSNLDYVRLTGKEAMHVYGDPNYQLKTYRFEAEHFVTDGGQMVNHANNEEANLKIAGTPSGAGFVGNLAGTSQNGTFTIPYTATNVPASQTSYLTVGAGRRGDANPKATWSITNNGTSFSYHDDAAISYTNYLSGTQSELPWYSWAPFFLADITISEGENELVIQKNGGEFTNIDYFEITTTATLSSRYIVDSVSTSLTGNAKVNGGGNANSHVGGLAAKESGSLTFQVYSDITQTVTFGVNFGEYQEFRFSDSFKLSLNDEALTSETVISSAETSPWTEWTDYDICEMTLEAGWNTIVVDKADVATTGTNIDYFYFDNVSDFVYFGY